MPTMQFTVWGAATATAEGPVLQEDVITIDVTATNTAAIEGSGRKMRRVRIFCDTDAWVTWGAPGITALIDGTEGRMMGAENPEYFPIEAGFEISVIARA